MKFEVEEMKDRKSFFGGLRRGNKQKETDDAVTSDKKTTENPSENQETSEIPAIKITIPETETSSEDYDNNTFSDHTRPNETLGNLISDIRRMKPVSEENDENVTNSVQVERDAVSTDNDSGGKDVTLSDIIAGIQKNKAESDIFNDEPEQEGTSVITVSVPETEDENGHQINVEELIQEIADEDTQSGTTEQEYGKHTTEGTIGPEKAEWREEPPEHDIVETEESEGVVPPHLDSPIQSIPLETTDEKNHDISDAAEKTENNHLDSLIAEIQQNTADSPVHESPQEPDSEQGQVIDGIIRELINDDQKNPAENFFDDDKEISHTGTLSSMIQEIQNSESVDLKKSSQDNQDDLINELVQRYDEAEQITKNEPPQNTTTRITQIIEEISSEGEKNIRKENVEIKPESKPSHFEHISKKKRQTNGIISAEEAATFSDLILSGGAELDLEDFHISDGARSFEMSNRQEIITALDGIAEGDLDRLDFSKIRPLEPVSEEEPEKKEKKKIFGQEIFGKIMGKVVHYDPAIHGSLLDLTHDSAEGVEEIELYPVNEPYAYIRIIFDHNSHEYLYTVIEPELSEGEKLLVQELTQRLFETLDVNTKDLTKERARSALTDAVDNIIFDYGIKLDPVSREKVLYHIHKNFLGDGLIDAIMHDKYIEDISCDGVNAPIFVFHSNYESIQTNLSYTRPDDLDSFVTKLAQRAGKYISIAEPMLDATMADGSRIQMTLGHEVTAHGSTFTIRKFKDEPITPTDLIEWGTYSPLSIAFLWLIVENGKSCIFAGGTASGKTTSLNAISLFIPPLAKIVTLEDTRELKLPHKNWIPSITRESFDTGGKGSIDMYELLRAALRQRPEYILVGEVRGKEAQTLFQAMSTGHVTYATTHADSVASVVHRFENPPMDVPRNMLSALDLVSVQVQARFGGQRIRRNKTLIEILDIDPRTNELITNEVFKWNAASDEIRFSGKSYILEDIMEVKGWSDSRMREELKRRQEILEWMRIKKIRHFQEVGKVLLSYYRDPETVMELVRSDLYE